VALLGRLVPSSQTDGSDLERLAFLCGHVPLALRIAGNRLASRQTWTVDDLAARLASEDRRISGLRAGDLEIRAAIALSYDRLSERGQRAFRRLALLRGTTFGDAVAARLVPTDLMTAEDIIEELADLGLVQPATQGRYHLHDLLRLFARDRLQDEEAVADRVAVEIDLRRWLLAVTIDAGRWFEPDFESAPPVPDPLVELDTADHAQSWLRAESEHWLIALHDSARVGEHQLVIDVAESLHWFSDRWAHWGHWHEVFSLAVQAARELGDGDALATQLGYLAWAELYTRLQPETGLSHAVEAGVVAQRAGNLRQAGWAAFYAQAAYRALGRQHEALASAQEAERVLAESGDVEGQLQARRAAALTLLHLGRYEEAVDHERRVLADLDDPDCALSPQIAALTRGASFSVITTGLAELGRWQETVDVVSDAFDRVPTTTEVVGILSRLLENRARALDALGRRMEAVADQARLIEVRESIGDAPGAAAARGLLAAPVHADNNVRAVQVTRDDSGVGGPVTSDSASPRGQALLTGMMSGWPTDPRSPTPAPVAAALADPDSGRAAVLARLTIPGLPPRE
jgi:tetratricopeptide (TPR) repeat protein